MNDKTDVDVSKFDNNENLGFTERAVILFCATQTKEKITRENIRGNDAEQQVYLDVEKKVRQMIIELGGLWTVG